jgi:hypothetical protein
VVGFCIWLAYAGSVGLLRVWALAATAALPIALAVGWYAWGLLAAERNAGRDEANQPSASRREQRGRSAHDGRGRGASDGVCACTKRNAVASPGDAGAIVPRADAGERGGGDY